MNLTPQVKTQIAVAQTAAGTSDITGSTIDTAGFEGVRFVVSFGTIAATGVQGLRVQQGAASDMSDAADLAGTAVAVADDEDNTLAIVEVHRPRERYVRCIVDRATANATVNIGIAELYGPAKMPVTQHADVPNSEIHGSPAEGTA